MSSGKCVLAMILAGGLARSATAQNPGVTGGQQTVVNDCLLPAGQGSDLIGCGLGFNSLGEITFSVKNRGPVAVNPTAGGLAVAGKNAPPPGPKIKMDLYLGDKLIQSVYDASLAAGQIERFTAKIPSNYPTPRCGETQPLKLVIDPQNQIAESFEDNNTSTRSADRPCPDMDVVSIKANYNSLKTEFVAEIVVANKGNADARFRYLALTSNGNPYGPLPSADFDKWMEIPAGGTKKFTIGNTFSGGTMYVRVFLDRWSEVAELDESNNFKEKTLP